MLAGVNETTTKTKIQDNYRYGTQDDEGSEWMMLVWYKRDAEAKSKMVDEIRHVVFT